MPSAVLARTLVALAAQRVVAETVFNSAITLFECVSLVAIGIWAGALLTHIHIYISFFLPRRFSPLFSVETGL